MTKDVDEAIQEASVKVTAHLSMAQVTAALEISKDIPHLMSKACQAADIDFERASRMMPVALAFAGSAVIYGLSNHNEFARPAADVYREITTALRLLAEAQGVQVETPAPAGSGTDAEEHVIRLTGAEVQSRANRVKWAEGLILQMPETHDGRNSWLINYGVGPIAQERREAWIAQHPHISPAEAFPAIAFPEAQEDAPAETDSAPDSLAKEALARIYSAAASIERDEEHPIEVAQDIQKMAFRGIGRVPFAWTHKPHPEVYEVDGWQGRIAEKVAAAVCDLPSLDERPPSPDLLVMTPEELALIIRRALGEDV